MSDRSSARAFPNLDTELGRCQCIFNSHCEFVVSCAFEGFSCLFRLFLSLLPPIAFHSIRFVSFRSLLLPNNSRHEQWPYSGAHQSCSRPYQTHTPLANRRTHLGNSVRRRKKKNKIFSQFTSESNEKRNSVEYLFSLLFAFWAKTSVSECCFVRFR